MNPIERLRSALQKGEMDAARDAAARLREAVDQPGPERLAALRAFADALPVEDVDAAAAWATIFGATPDVPAVCDALVRGAGERAPHAARALLALDDATEAQTERALRYLASREHDPARAETLRAWADRQSVIPLLRPVGAEPTHRGDAPPSVPSHALDQLAGDTQERPPLADALTTASSTAVAPEQGTPSAAQTDESAAPVEPPAPEPPHIAAGPRVDEGAFEELLRLESLLDQDAREAAPFEALVELLVSLEAWEDLLAAYARMLARCEALQPRDATAEAALWWELGELALEKTGERSKAFDAFERAALVDPTSRSAERAAETAAQITPPSVSLAFRAQSAAPSSPGVLTALGRALTRAGRETEATIASQCAAFASGGSSSVEVRATSVRPSDWCRQLSDSDVAEALRPADRDAQLDRFFAAAGDVLAPLYGQSLETLELSERNRLPPDDPLDVSQVIDALWRAGGLPGAPAVYIQRELTEVSYAFFDSPAFLVGGDLAQSTSRGRLRYRVGCALTWARPYAFLAGLLNESQLQQVLEVSFDVLRPGGSLTLSKAYQRLKRFLAGVPPERVALLRSAAEAMERPSSGAIRRWRRDVAVEAMHTGALFCGLPVLVLDELARRPPLEAGMDADAWRSAALTFLSSGRHLELRASLMGDRRSAIETQQL